MKRTIQSLVLGAILALSGGLTTAAALDSMDVKNAIAAAKAAQKQANAAGGEWRDTGKMIKKAEKLLKEGKLEEAEKLARTAEAQGMLGYMQATAQTPDKLHVN